MFDFFGADTLLAVRFFLAFIVVLAVIGVAAWAVRRLGSARTGHAVRGDCRAWGSVTTLPSTRGADGSWFAAITLSIW